MLYLASMEDGARLKLIILGLVLAAIAGAYLFFSGRFASRTTTNDTSQPDNRVTISSPRPSSTASGLVIPPGIPLQSDVGQLPPTGEKGGPGVSNLPNTGLPMELIGSLGAAAIAVGYALRRFPK